MEDYAEILKATSKNWIVIDLRN